MQNYYPTYQFKSQVRKLTFVFKFVIINLYLEIFQNPTKKGLEIAMKENDKNNNIDLEIIMGDDSELNFSDVNDSIKTLRPKDKVQKKNIIIPKTKTEKEENK